MERLRDDLSARVTDANKALEQSMSERVSQLGEAMTAAIERGQSRKSATEEEQVRQQERARRLHEAAESARNAAREEAEGTVSV